MTIEIQERIEGRRGCGFRKPGGIYLVGPAEGMACCKLPWPLTTCPCCGAGIKPSRGWTWVDASKLFFPDKDVDSCTDFKTERHRCPLAERGSIHMAGLIWVGEQFYATPTDFLSEAVKMGISRRITVIPNGFELGKTWVLLAHRKVIGKEVEVKDGLPGATEIKYDQAIFAIFRPKAIEYVVTGQETDVQLERLVKRGITLVNVNPRKAYK